MCPGPDDESSYDSYLSEGDLDLDLDLDLDGDLCSVPPFFKARTLQAHFIHSCIPFIHVFLTFRPGAFQARHISPCV